MLRVSQFFLQILSETWFQTGHHWIRILANEIVKKVILINDFKSDNILGKKVWFSNRNWKFFDEDA